jgi:hypothetical protein
VASSSFAWTGGPHQFPFVAGSGGCNQPSRERLTLALDQHDARLESVAVAERKHPRAP